ncbi:ABC transporter permease [Methanoregula sp.]|uniref:ABC transporter permease n=1 Tax=Methanoregula sp. TaxID=2052170 RepID=UPI002CAC75FC|nr:ABC transporter permease [Methanoregula sp.]HVP97035.1 ABC transporter permease [Methanoregula sp.]
MIKGDIFFSLALRSVRINFLRSILAAIGIVIGVVAISSMGMLGTNMQLEVKDQLSASANTIVITPDVVRMGPPGFAPSSSSTTATGITKNELAKITMATGSNGTVIPIYSTNTQFTINSIAGRGSVYGINPLDIPKFLSLNQSYGNGTTDIGAGEVLVGAEIAENFNLKVGTRIRIGSYNSASRPELRIAGVLMPRGTVADGVSTDNGIVVNDNWYTNQYGGEDEWNQVNVIVNNVDNISDIESAISGKVNANEKTPVIRTRDATSQLATETAALGTVTTFIMAIGGISLLVAAVSIFNVMMMSVSERIQEIGILLSIGTEKGEIRRMFLYEAFILGLLGAGVGGACSLAIGYTVVEAMIGTTAYFFLPASILYIPAAMLIGVAVCVLSGMYPAWKASNMDPIDAIRSEE